MISCRRSEPSVHTEPGTIVTSVGGFCFVCCRSFSRSRRQLAALNKDCQFGFSAEAVEEPTDLDPTIAYYQLDDGSDAVFPPLPVRKPTHTSQELDLDSTDEVLVTLANSMLDYDTEADLCYYTNIHHVCNMIWLLPQGQTVAPPPTMGAPPPPPGSSYRVQRGSGPLPPAPPPGNTPVCSSEEDQEDTSTVEDQGEDSV